MSVETTSPEPEVNEEQSGPERRRAERFLCRRACIVRPDGAPGVGDWSGMTYNISTLGVGVALLYPICPETLLVITPLGRQFSKSYRARVVRSVLEEFVWFHGCEFVEPLTEKELKTWLK